MDKERAKRTRNADGLEWTHALERERQAFRNYSQRDFGGPARIPYGTLKGAGKGQELLEKTMNLYSRGWKAVKIGSNKWVTMELGQMTDQARGIRAVQKGNGNWFAIRLETEEEKTEVVRGPRNRMTKRESGEKRK